MEIRRFSMVMLALIMLLPACYETIGEADAGEQDSGVADGGKADGDGAKTDGGLDEEDGGEGPSTECGNGVIEPGEHCDGEEFSGATCRSLGYGDGQLRCDPSTCVFDLSMCMSIDAGGYGDGGYGDGGIGDGGFSVGGF